MYIGHLCIAKVENFRNSNTFSNTYTCRRKSLALKTADDFNMNWIARCLWSAYCRRVSRLSPTNHCRLDYTFP